MRRNIKSAILFATGILTSYFYSWNVPALSQSKLVSQASSTTDQSSPVSNQLSNGITIAVVSAILGFLANVTLESIKKRNVPRKQISYAKSIKSGIVGTVEKDVESKVSILYHGKPAKNMFYVLFDIENTGNQQVRNQEIRFEFTEGSEILDVFFEPQKIPPEMSFENIEISGSGKNEKKYKLGTIKPQEKFGFRFIVQGHENKGVMLEHYTKNDEDVSFIEREVKKVADDIEQVKSFSSLVLTFFVLLPIIQNLLSKLSENLFFYPPLRDLGALVVYPIALIVFVFVILPRLGRFIEAIVNLVSGSSQKQPNIQANGAAFIALEGSRVTVDKVTMAGNDSKIEGY